MTVEQWANTPMMQDAYTAVAIWKGDGTCRRVLHFQLLASDYGLSDSFAMAVLATIENTN